MAALSDHIEQFIMELFDEESNHVDIQRNELAQYFHCVPSQINYVLTTRFTVERGYLIESRRGGGGYVRIARLERDKDDFMLELITTGIGTQIDEKTAEHIIEALWNDDVIEEGQQRVMKAAVSNKAIELPNSLRNKVRADLLKSMIIAIMNE